MMLKETKDVVFDAQGKLINIGHLEEEWLEEGWTNTTATMILVNGVWLLEDKSNDPSLTTEKLLKQIAELESEKTMLLSSMMEMSSYMATQDERLAGQESAIMELSVLVAMSMGGGD